MSRCGLTISGMYHAHDNIRDNHVDTFSQKIADKIADNVPGTILVTLDSKKLSLNIDTHALIVQQHDTNSGEFILLSVWECKKVATTFSKLSVLIAEVIICSVYHRTISIYN